MFNFTDNMRTVPNVWETIKKQSLRSLTMGDCFFLLKWPLAQLIWTKSAMIQVHVTINSGI